MPQRILFVPSSKFIEDPVTSHHVHATVLAGHYPLFPELMVIAPDCSPFFHTCSNITRRNFWNMSDYVTSLLKTHQRFFLSLKIKPSVSTLDQKAPYDLPPISLISRPSLFFSEPSPPSMVSLLFFKHIKYNLATGLLYWWFPFPGTTSPPTTHLGLSFFQGSDQKSSHQSSWSWYKISHPPLFGCVFLHSAFWHNKKLKIFLFLPPQNINPMKGRHLSVFFSVVSPAQWLKQSCCDKGETVLEGESLAQTWKHFNTCSPSPKIVDFWLFNLSWIGFQLFWNSC